MAAISDNRVAWTYTADDGTTYRLAAVDGYVTQVSGTTPLQGGSAAAAGLRAKPASLKPRRITVRDTVNGDSRVIPVYTTDAPIITPGTTIMLNRLGDSYSYTSFGGLLNEDNGRRVIKQST